MRQSRSTPKSASIDMEDNNIVDSPYRSTPPPPGPINLTPPPSTQIPKAAKSAKMPEKRESSLASPPPTSKTSPPISQGRLFGEVPTMEAVEKMPEEQVRSLVAELLTAVGEARTLAAHSKLQHTLLSIESDEAARRAEVEREMALREHQVLQESPRRLGHSMSPHSPQVSAQRHLDLALKKCRQLQYENEQLERRMQSARKLIRDLSAKSEDLLEDNSLLRQRIKQNREHLNAMRSSGAISVNGTPLTEFATPIHRTPRTPATARSAQAINNPPSSQGAFDALLFAGQVLNNEANSVPSTPTRTKPRKSNQANHMRGAHSLSSLPSTPNRSRPVTADNALLTPTPQRAANPRASLSGPSKQLIRDESPRREERDSTISASEDEGEQYPEHVPASQASQRATDMLRRSIHSKESSPRSSQAHKASQLLRHESSQRKLIGQVKKHRGDGVDRVEKRVGSGSVYEDIGRGTKKAKMGSDRRKSVGLGIDVPDE
ncbi:MAG: hypothetical protein LQ338_006114 [Usnochroma carphineum]|nr:MAG: hypothetical protein LQ338_006114 [Usnochroma carphineum]